MIKGQCFTNLDDYQRCIWPETFVSVPIKGDFVKASNGKMLKVYNITHTLRETEFKTVSNVGIEPEPFIIVELNRL